MSIERLSEIQKTLVVPKGQFNSFGGYKYRSCEDIVEAVKKVLKGDEALIMQDEVEEVAGQIFVQASATLYIGDSLYFATGHAMHPLQKKGMDASQITGAASSYARKYALNGLFCIDDTKDADTDEHRKQSDAAQQKKAPPMTEEQMKARELIFTMINEAKSPKELDETIKSKAFLAEADKLPEDSQKKLEDYADSKRTELMGATNE